MSDQLGATLRQRYESRKADANGLWLKFVERKEHVESNGATAEDVKELQDSFYEPYLKARDEYEEADGQYRKHLEMLAVERTEEEVEEKETVEDESIESNGKSKIVSPGERFTTSANYKAMVASGALDFEGTRPKIDHVQVMSSAEMKTLLYSGTPSGWIANIRRPGVLPLPQAGLRISNLVTVRQLSSGNTVEWVRNSAITNNAAEVGEAESTSGTSGTKPESAMTFVVESTPVRTIAHWLPVTRQALSDIPLLRGMIDDTLTDGVNRRLNNQMVNGDGVAPNLSGLSTVVTATQALGADNRFAAIFKAVTTVRSAFYEPSAILMNPADWQDVVLTRDDAGATGGTGSYMLGGPGLSIEPQMWGLRVIIDPTIAAGTAIVGDFRQAVLYIREGVAVYMTDSHSDWFVRNILVLLAEGRFAFVVERPTAFVKVTGI